MQIRIRCRTCNWNPAANRGAKTATTKQHDAPCELQPAVPYQITYVPHVSIVSRGAPSEWATAPPPKPQPNGRGGQNISARPRHRTDARGPKSYRTSARKRTTRAMHAERVPLTIAIAPRCPYHTWAQAERTAEPQAPPRCKGPTNWREHAKFGTQGRHARSRTKRCATERAMHTRNIPHTIVNRLSRRSP